MATVYDWLLLFFVIALLMIITYHLKNISAHLGKIAEFQEKQLK